MGNDTSQQDEETRDPAEIPPNELSKPIGDAIPTPVEPGLDQPLPEKDKSSEASDEPLGDPDPPPGVPAPGPSDFA